MTDNQCAAATGVAAAAFIIYCAYWSVQGLAAIVAFLENAL